jgi:hypothetical protein
MHKMNSKCGYESWSKQSDFGSPGKIRTLGFEECGFWRGRLPFFGNWVVGLDPVRGYNPLEPVIVMVFLPVKLGGGPTPRTFAHFLYIYGKIDA